MQNIIGDSSQSITFAQFVGSGSTGLIGALNTVVVPLIGTFIFFIFIWGVVKYFFFYNANGEKRAEARGFMLWSLLGMVVFFSVWGIVNILLSTLGITPSA